MFCDLGLFIIIDSMICYINIILYISFVCFFVGSVFIALIILLYNDMIIILDLMFYILYNRYIIGSM